MEHMGWQTAMAENGLEALEQVAQFKPHLVCMDRHMPVSAGCPAWAECQCSSQVMAGDESIAELRRRGYDGACNIAVARGADSAGLIAAGVIIGLTGDAQEDDLAAFAAAGPNCVRAASQRPLVCV